MATEESQLPLYSNHSSYFSSANAKSQSSSSNYCLAQELISSDLRLKLNGASNWYLFFCFAVSSLSILLSRSSASRHYQRIFIVPFGMLTHGSRELCNYLGPLASSLLLDLLLCCKNKTSRTCIKARALRFNFYSVDTLAGGQHYSKHHRGCRIWLSIASICYI